MISITYPTPEFRIKKEQDKDMIFDAFRKRWILLTPEEWVRQNFIQYLISEKKYPATLIAIEKEILLGELKKRFDVLIYDASHKPWMMVECKAASVNMTSSVLEQALRYNISIPVQYIVITNGNNTFGWERADGVLKLIDTIPEWS